MAKTRKVITFLTRLTVVILFIAVGACNKDNSTPAADRKISYSLKVKDVLGVSGTATFTETSSTVTTIDIVLTGAPSGTHPAELCTNSAIEGGTVVITFNPVDATGKSSTSVTTLTYTQLISYDGFIKVLKSSTESDVIFAQGDIGGNVITTTNKTYILDTIGSYGVSGTALFEKRVNGNTLVTIMLTGTIPGDVYPATINLGSIASVGGGPVVKALNNVDGTTGKSYTNIKKLDSGIDITYDNWLVYDGYINIYQTSVNIGNIICHGNIGSN
ncbi:MAG: hypothetical protein NTX61_04025 [Bacteroidetes bacterium]|nr:hypothetical protein [Bacteroidota bacterium]